MRNVIASCKRHGEHELTDDGRKNLQRHEKPRDNRLTLTSPPVSLKASKHIRQNLLMAQSDKSRGPGAQHPSKDLPKICVCF
jgi:hypothetical protein